MAIDRRLLLAGLRYEISLGYRSLDPIYRVITWSFNDTCMNLGIQGTQTMTDTMLNRRFLDLCRLHTINPGQTYIGTAHLHQEDWAELRLKAYASRVFTAFMAVCLQVVQRQRGNSDMDLNLITVATHRHGATCCSNLLLP